MSKQMEIPQEVIAVRVSVASATHNQENVAEITEEIAEACGKVVKRETAGERANANFYEVACTGHMKKIEALRKICGLRVRERQVIDKAYDEAQEEITRLKFMIDNGLGWEDMKNDIGEDGP